MFWFSSLIYFFFSCTFPWYSIYFVLYLLDLIIFSSDYENSLLLASYHLIFHSSIFFSSVLADQMRGFSSYRYLQCLPLYFNTIFYQLCYEIFLSFVCWKQNASRMLLSSMLYNWIEISCHPPLKYEVSAVAHFPLNLFYLSPSPYIISSGTILSAKVRWVNKPVCLCLSYFFLLTLNL